MITNFPHDDLLNHSVLVYDRRPGHQGTDFVAYDPNDPGSPLTLYYDAGGARLLGRPAHLQPAGASAGLPALHLAALLTRARALPALAAPARRRPEHAVDRDARAQGRRAARALARASLQPLALLPAGGGGGAPAAPPGADLARRPAGGLLLARFPAERAAVRRNLTRIQPGHGPVWLDAAVDRVFARFAVCFADLLSLNRGPRSGLWRHVIGIDGQEPTREALKLRARLRLHHGAPRELGAGGTACSRPWALRCTW